MLLLLRLVGAWCSASTQCRVWVRGDALGASALPPLLSCCLSSAWCHHPSPGMGLCPSGSSHTQPRLGTGASSLAKYKPRGLRLVGDTLPGAQPPARCSHTPGIQAQPRIDLETSCRSALRSLGAPKCPGAARPILREQRLCPRSPRSRTREQRGLRGHRGGFRGFGEGFPVQNSLRRAPDGDTR